VSVYAVLQPTVRLVVAQAEIARNLSTGVSDAIPRALEYAGYACASDFWEDFLSEPREAEDFVHFISRFHLTPTNLDVQAVSMALRSFLKDAKRIKYPFILTPEDRAEKALIDPREAVRRLLSTLRRRSLIPVELAQHIERPVLEPSSQAAAPGDEASSRPNGGRPQAADWYALEEAFNKEVDLFGLPHKGAEPGWRTAGEWLRENLGDAEPSKTTVNEHAREMLQRRRERDGK
jgi:hypothetical protein